MSMVGKTVPVVFLTLFSYKSDIMSHGSNFNFDRNQILLIPNQIPHIFIDNRPKDCPQNHHIYNGMPLLLPFSETSY